MAKVSSVCTPEKLATSSQLGSHVRILGLVATRYDRRERVSLEVLRALREQFPSLLFETVIRVNVRLKESPSYTYCISCFGLT